MIELEFGVVEGGGVARGGEAEASGAKQWHGRTDEEEDDGGRVLYTSAISCTLITPR
jgi:hypothetical protein